MPFTTRPYDSFVQIKSGCQVSGKDILETVKLVFEDEELLKFRLQIWDYSQAQGLSVKLKDMQELLELALDYTTRGQKYFIAFVCPNHSVSFRLQALIDYVGNKYYFTAKIFENIEEARQWISLQDTTRA